ncbi:MAG: DUF2183 domain-containing protein [Oligoflexia bacterium]|nr:DUF2183 domain-containing protein [Oligoflexia bacterium]MBF0365473.1 DUF2183 domain-containing protein [Oligoflexia bacterium]
MIAKIFCHLLKMLPLKSKHREQKQSKNSQLSLVEAIPEVVILSDLDDTIKMTNVRKPYSALSNHLWHGIRPFSRLIDIYKDIKRHYEKAGKQVSFYYVSAAPPLIDQGHWLKHHGAPLGEIIQRSYLEYLKSTEEYKFKKIKKLLLAKVKQATQQNRSLILYLFGDNGEYDPQIYHKIAADPDLSSVKKHIFIRMVTAENQKLPNLTYFTSEFDLINKAPSISRITSLSVKEKIANEYHLGKLIPEYVLQTLDEEEESPPKSSYSA